MKFRPRFSLKTLLAAITCFGVWFGWQTHIVRVRQDYEQRKTSMGWIFRTSDDALADKESVAAIQTGHAAIPPQISWVRRLLGDHAIYGIAIPDPSRKGAFQDTQEAKKIFPEVKFVGIYIPNSDP